MTAEAPTIEAPLFDSVDPAYEARVAADEKMKANINAARQAVGYDREHYYSNTPSQEALSRGAEWGKTEIIGNDYGDVRATVQTKKGIQPDYFRQGAGAQPSYEVAGARVTHKKPTGETVTFEARQMPDSKDLATSYIKYRDGEILADKKIVAPEIGRRVVNLAAQRITRMNSPSKFKDV